MIMLALVYSGIALLFLFILLANSFLSERRDSEEALFVLLLLLLIIDLISFGYFSLDEIIYDCYYYSTTSLARLFGCSLDSLETIIFSNISFSLILGEDFCYYYCFYSCIFSFPFSKYSLSGLVKSTKKGFYYKIAGIVSNIL